MPILLTFFTIIVMLAVGYGFLREGLLTAFCMCVNTFVAGLIAFNFWEPLADLIEPMLPVAEPNKPPPFFWGYEDALSMMVLFWGSLLLLRFVTNSLTPTEVQYHGYMRSGGAALMGMITGYLLSGFLICVFQTLPWHENFMLFQPAYKAPDSTLRQILPPDFAWLAMMHRAGAYTLANEADESVADDRPLDERYKTFDRNGGFELRYARYRRYGETQVPHRYLGECEEERRGELDSQPEQAKAP
jgi:hypothetical protein